MITATATYFDGQSAMPQNIEIEIDLLNGILKFSVPVCGATEWPVSNVRIRRTGTTMNIYPGTAGAEFVKTSDRRFINLFGHYLETHGRVSTYQKILNMGLKNHIAIALTLLGAIVAAYFYLIPWVGQNAVILIPDEFDNKMGSMFFNEFVLRNDVDSARTEQMNLFAAKLDLKNRKAIRFTVVDSPIVNAFALPDGNVVIYTGIIDEIQSYDELTGLICHEVVHVNERHSMKMMCRNLAGYIFISAIFSDVNGIMAVIGDNVHNLQSLSYSRQFERQADREGVSLMISNHVNPHGMVRLFERLMQNEHFMLPEFMSSHPLTLDRIDDINRVIISTPCQVSNNKELDQIFSQIKYSEE